MNDIREREGGRKRLLQISCVESKAFNSDSRRSLSLTCIDNSNGNESTEVQTLGVIRIQLIYSINVLSKYSSLIVHRPSIFEGRHIDHRSSKIDISIFDGQHIDLDFQMRSKIIIIAFPGI